MRVIVLGATGEMGRRVSSVLESRDHSVGRVSRSTGVDVVTGEGLAAAFAGADTVLDCLNQPTLSARKATVFFTTAARQVTDAALAANVRHLVCLSIVNVTDPGVGSRLGYYRGKAAQEAVYRAAAVPATVVSSAQWFELARSLLHQIRLGRVAFVPRMLAQPVAAGSVAAYLADVVAEGHRPGILRTIAGPERHDLADLARRLAAIEEPLARVIGVPVLGAAIAHGALLPGALARVDPVRFEDWLVSRHD
ncbi:uncharacterized protein YbjT (DUF2867 family) [Cryobacterium sp. MP_M5]|uniref:SDR family oxidoreductase n=1 Tax=unclassified Cryobacterium TaxID=2649013 RepID=UPI0018CAA0A9|nr:MULTISPECIES: NAD(P)H-binding protein [unclassified Cryobacterium]MBG6059223.1 uncharacterized protein YbjT (DUF2867 family) [Cryobacterium sp. MP_M3]MEC5177517.1 uncharacterized protein YbjT (DUF2867 family) [Cryobacterium sp. MP_M5]